MKQYVGKGLIANEFARLQREKQQLLQARRRSVREFGEQLQHYERILKPFWSSSEAVLACAVAANRSRDYFVSREAAEQVIAACPDPEWRLIFALARYGGFRTPSETLSLK